ncbi:phage tail tape measure protein [Peribacillus asahii]|uniref:phage tail tape measure protein n=1 Tax=Peribacillus asahii TaxID=228899 RepID=UPI0020796C9E|nr:phage tail tape measure protein [Peribacillus asahii]USK71766.1 phage tail tape measure protein [Peribacillus asahii]
MARSLRNTTMRVKMDVETRGLTEANRQIDATRRNMEQLERTAGGASNGIDRTRGTVIYLDRAMRNSTNSTNDNTRSTNRNTNAQDDLNESLANRERRTRRARDAQDDLTNSTRCSRDELTRSRRQLADWSESISASGRKLQKLGRTVQDTGKQISTFGQDVTSSMADVTLAVGTGVGYAVKQAADYEQAMKNVESLMSASEWQQSGDSLNKMVTKLGMETKYSSTEVAGGLEELIKAGVGTQDILAGGLKDALNLATAGGLDLAKASEVMSTALNSFTNDTISSTRAADLLAGSANASATNVHEMAYGLSQSAAVANNLKFSFEETSTTLAVLAQNGLKGSDAGTSLKTMLMNLSPQTKDAATQMEQLGLGTTNVANGYNFLIKQGITPASKGFDDISASLMAMAKEQAGAGATATKIQKEYDKLASQSGLVSSAFFDANGQARDMDEIFQLLQDSLKGLSDEQQQNALKTMFGTDAVRAATIAADQGAKGYKTMNDAMQGTTAASVAAEKMDTLYGSLNMLKSSSNTLATDFGTALIPTIKSAAEGVTDLTNWFNSLDQSTKESAAKWTLIALAGGALVTGFGLVSIAVGGAVTGVGALIGAFGKLRSGAGYVGSWLSGSRRAFDEETDSINRNTDALARNNRQRNQGTGGGNARSSRNSTSTPASSTRSYSDMMREAQNRRTRASNSSTPAPATETAESSTPRRGVISRMGSRVRSGIQFSGASRAVPVVGTALAATSLIGMTRDTVGEDLGGFGGALAGGAAGAAIGSVVAPGIGTAIGGMIGSLAGTKFGSEFGATVQEKWPEIKKTVSDFTEKHPILTQVATNVIPGATLVKGAVSAKNAYDNAVKDPLTDKVDFGKGVSESTEKAYNSYKKLNDKATEQLNLLYWSGEKISKKTAKSLKANYNDMADSIQRSMKIKFGKSEKTLSDFMKDSGFSEKEQSAITKSVEKNHKKQKETVEKYQGQINKILDKAAKERRSLTDDERRDINQIQNKMNKTAVKTLSKSAKEQETIMTMLKAESGRISAKQAADVVKQSKKARDGAVKEADKKYKEVVAAANEEFSQNKSITEEQRDAIVKKAKETRDESVTQAEDMHTKVVEQAKKQAEGHVKQVDWETGQVLSKWDQFKADLAGPVNAVTSNINKVLEFFNLPQIPEWKPAGYTSSTPKKTANYASGTNYHPGGASVVGEEGPELAYTPYGDAWLVGQNGAEIIDLPRGAKVLTASQTAQMMSGGLKGTMPGYAGGIGGSIKEAASTVANKAKDTASSAINKTKEVAGSILNTAGEITDDILDFMADPASAIKKIIAKNPLSNDIGGIGKGALGKIKDGAVDYLKDKVSSFGFGSTGGVGITGGASAWSSMIVRAAAQMRVALSGRELQGIIAQIQRESSGNEKIIQSADVNDINMRNGNPARGLLQYIPQTFNAYKVKGFGDIMNGYHQLLAFFNNSKWRSDLPYGRSGWGPSGSRRFEKGGRVNQNGQVLVGEGGPEIVDLPFGSYVNNNRKTNELLKNKSGSDININFNPTIQITIQGGNETNEAAIQRAVNAALERAFKDFRALIDSGVAY